MGTKKAARSRTSLWRIAPQLVVVLLVLGLASAMAIQPTRQLFEQRDRIASMSNDLNTVEKANRRLESRIKRLKNPDYIEQEARRSGLVRPGETTYVVMPPSRKSKSGRSKPPAPPDAQHEPSIIESFLHFVGLG